ncbi:MAG: FAD:protein FMN transferase [Candidatus Omnitrophica bacterium]|nr:FAD:protein FMN transferase [Candidatus Omnitrophota bacterium]
MPSTNSTISPQSYPQNLKEYYEVRSYFGTSVWIHCFYDVSIDIADAVKKCWAKAEQMQRYMNVYGEPMEGSLRWLNSQGTQGVRVHEDVYKILKKSLLSSKLTKGAFDVTIFPLVELWKEAVRIGQIPDENLLKTVKDKVGYQNILLQEPNLVFLLKKGVMIDLGSPASGYFCDEVANILDANHIGHFMVDGGGEIFCRGKEKGERPWRVGVQDPFNKNNLVTTIELFDKGISTSGNYEKYSTIGDEKFAHIIDPRTGYPEKDAASVTVIAETTQLANELSTALCVLGAEKGLEFVRTLKNVEALIIENKKGTVNSYQTDGFQKNNL